MREADLLVNRLPAQLQSHVRAARRHLSASSAEVEAVVERLVRDAIDSAFGSNPEATIVEAVIAERRRRDEAALEDLRNKRRPALRRAG